MGYTKLFNEIVLSTVWREPDTIRIVWITMLALRNRNHIVEASLPGLADCAHVSIENCKKALDYLLSPDPYSRSKELEGRRIQEVEGGWWIVNGEKYRRKMNEEERRANNAIYQRKYRERKKSVSIDLTNEQSEHSKSKRKRQSKSRCSTTSNDVVNNGELFVSELSKDSTYEGIDVLREYGKMKNWCMVHNVMPTRRRFVNWLNRVDKPLKPTKSARDRWEVFPKRPSREPTEEELAAQRKIVREASEQLKNQLTKGNQ